MHKNCSIGLDTGSMQIRQQAIIWTINYLVYWRIYVSLGLNGEIEYIAFLRHWLGIE